MGRAKKDSMRKLQKMKNGGLFKRKPEALRKESGVKKGEKMPTKKLEKAAHSKNPLIKKGMGLAGVAKKYRPQGR